MTNPLRFIHKVASSRDRWPMPRPYSRGRARPLSAVTRLELDLLGESRPFPHRLGGAPGGITCSVSAGLGRGQPRKSFGLLVAALAGLRLPRCQCMAYCGAT